MVGIEKHNRKESEATERQQVRQSLLRVFAIILAFVLMSGIMLKIIFF